MPSTAQRERILALRLQCDEPAREMADSLCQLKLGSDADTLKHYQELKKQQVDGELQDL